MQLMWPEVRSQHFCQKCKKIPLCLMAKLQIPVLTPVTFKHLHHAPSKLLYQTEESDNSGGLENV